VATSENGKLVWGARVDQAFRVKVREIADRLSTDPNWLMAVMGFETGYTFSPAARNPGSTATGLIQFIESTARGLGTSTAQLARMTAVRQLDYVEDYYRPYNGRIRNLGDAYLAVLWPVAVGRPDSYVMWERDSGPYQREYAANSGLDVNHDGVITRGEAVASVNTSYMRGQQFVR
jgi:lysozyme family protein